MAFDAGSILGHLGLDISEYGKGILEAQGLNELFPESVATFLENPLLGLIDLAKEMADAYAEAFSEVQKDALEAGLAAEKAGTSVQFMSEWSEVAKAAGVDAGALGAAFKGLQRNASDAAENGGASLKYWQELGITQDDLKAHLGDTAGLFLMVKDHLDQLGNSADRVAIAQKLLGRGGSELIPVFDMQNDAVQRIIDHAQQMGAIETSESAKSAKAVNELSNTFTEGFTGMAKAATEPILGFLGEHAVQIEGIVTEAFNSINEDIAAVFHLSTSNGPAILQMIQESADLLVGLSNTITVIIESIEWIISKNQDIANIIGSIATLNGGGLGNAFNRLVGLSPDNFGPSSYGSTNNINISLNNDHADEKTAQMVGLQTRQALQQASQKRQKQTTAAVHQNLVAQTIGGI
jgi:hypothetical protein